MANVFLDYNGIITDPSIEKETSLTWANDGWQDGLNHIDNDFSYQMVYCVAKSYWYKIREDGGICTLSDLAEVGGVYGRVHLIFLEDPLTIIDGFFPYGILELFI